MRDIFNMLSKARNKEIVNVSVAEATMLLMEQPKMSGTFSIVGEKKVHVSWPGGGGVQALTFRCELGSGDVFFWSDDHRKAVITDLTDLKLQWAPVWFPRTAREMKGCM